MPHRPVVCLTKVGRVRRTEQIGTYVARGTDSASGFCLRNGSSITGSRPRIAKITKLLKAIARTTTPIVHIAAISNPNRCFGSNLVVLVTQPYCLGLRSFVEACRSASVFCTAC